MLPTQLGRYATDLEVGHLCHTGFTTVTPEDDTRWSNHKGTSGSYMRRLGFKPKYESEMREVEGCCRGMKVRGWYDLMKIKKALVGKNGGGGELGSSSAAAASNASASLTAGVDHLGGGGGLLELSSVSCPTTASPH